MNDTEHSKDKLLIITVSDTKYSIPVKNVESVISLCTSAISTIPFDSNGKIRGVFSYKGSIVAIVKKDYIQAQCDINKSEKLTAVILNCKNYRFALLVDNADYIIAAKTDKNTVLLDVERLYNGDIANDN